MKKLRLFSQILFLLSFFISNTLFAQDDILDKVFSRGKQRGYKSIFQVTKSINSVSDGCVTPDGLDFWELDFVGGYQYNPYFFLGVGLGLGFSDSSYDKDTPITVPIFGHMEVTFLDYSIAPYVSLGLGYAAGLRHGTFFHLQLGASLTLHKNVA